MVTFLNLTDLSAPDTKVSDSLLQSKYNPRLNHAKFWGVCVKIKRLRDPPILIGIFNPHHRRFKISELFKADIAP